MGVYVYIDGFNVYYRLFNNTRRHHRLPPHYKWLNLLQLSQQLKPGQDIDWIGYFTAFVSQKARDPGQHLRQRAYIEALRTIPCMEIVSGNFQLGTKWGVPVGSATNKPIEFSMYEEKGSDVNLATRLVWDAARNAFSEALVISNDSDLTEAVRIATAQAGKAIHVLSPDVTVSNALRGVATSAGIIDVKLFKKCLFPETITNPDGVTISKPAEWS